MRNENASQAKFSASQAKLSLRWRRRSSLSDAQISALCFQFVMHGLDTCIQGRRPRIVTKGVAWMPGSMPGMTEGSGSRPAR